MGTTVDHLSQHQNVRVIRAFTDAAGNRFEPGTEDHIAEITLDWHTFACTIRLEKSGAVLLHNKRDADGPRSGNMRDYFEVLSVTYPAREVKKPTPGIWDAPSQDPWPNQWEAMRQAMQHRHNASLLAAEGNDAEAAVEYQRARDAAWFFASQATSGGEGKALSLERDEFLRTLPPEPVTNK